MNEERFTLHQTGRYAQGFGAPEGLRNLFTRIKNIFSFRRERENRHVRFIRVVAAYRSGKKVAEIEHEFGCSKHTVLRYARLAGLDKRPKTDRPELKRAVIALYEMETPIAAIAAQLGISQSYVSMIAKEAGILRRTFKKRLTKEGESG